MSDLSKVGITSFGGYVPRLRLSRKSIAEANAWFAPALMGQAKGERAICNWDEDSITMSVEAGLDCIGDDTDGIGSLYLASTTLPFVDRQNAGILAGALSLNEDIHAADVTACQKAALSALVNGINAAAVSGKDALVISGEQRKARVAGASEMQRGDAAAAIRVGTEGVIANYLGGSGITVDFVDHFRGEGEDFDYNWEERWVRDEGYSKIMPKAITAALEDAGIKGEEINHFVMPCLFKGIPQRIAGLVGIDPETVHDNLAAVCGDSGVAHPLVMLVDTLQEAKPGDKILVAAFGQGAEVLIFEATDAITACAASRRGIKGSLAHKKSETNYLKWLAFTGMVELDAGMRAEKDNKVAMTVSYRKRDMLASLTGGKCSTCGTEQFPRTRICVNPNCGEVDTQEPCSFRTKQAKIMSWSADYLTYSMDPPSHFGMVTFEDGGRFMTDFTDVEVGTVDSGMDVTMVFRIKDFDKKRGNRKYFWKAVPIVSAQAAAE